MVLSRLTGSDEEEKDVAELEEELASVDREIKTLEGKRRTEALKKEKRRKLKEKKRQVKKEKLKQTRAGKVLDRIGEGLDSIAETSDDEETSSILDGFVQGIEEIDGDGKGDTTGSLGIGLKSEDAGQRDIEVEGDINVEGDIQKSGEGGLLTDNQSDKKSRTGTLSEDMKDIIG